MEKLEKLSLDNSLFSYEAFECPQQFVIHLEGIAADVEALAGADGAEVGW